MSCQVCGNSALTVQMNFGNHPVASFYLSSPDVIENNVNLRLSQCDHCGLVQLIEPIRHDLLISPYDWILSREPEQHLDDVVSRIVLTTSLPLQAVIAGLTYKDDSTLHRFRSDHGYQHIWRVDIKNDLRVNRPNASIETVQKMVEPQLMYNVAERRGGQVDLLIGRHVIEHSENLRQFIAGLSALVKPGGYLMVEAPDCFANLSLCDTCMVWEEHSLYFTPATFSNVLTSAGFITVMFENYLMPFENCMVLLARKQGGVAEHVVSDVARTEVGLLKSYASSVTESKQLIRSHLQRVRQTEGPIALLGAGHLACAFLCFYGLSDLVDFVVDDTPEKQGLFLPGAKMPIYSTRFLTERKVSLCLLAVSPASEESIIAKNSPFVKNGGRFASILAASPRSVYREF